EVARVRATFRLYLERQALVPAVQELERRGWFNKRWVTRKGRRRGGRPFTKPRLYELLTNVLYLGKVRHKHEVHDGEHPAIVPARSLGPGPGPPQAERRCQCCRAAQPYRCFVAGLVALRGL